MNSEPYLSGPVDQEEAEARCTMLADYLKSITGVKWYRYVHENLGWHYRCISGSLVIREYPAENYGSRFAVMNSASEFADTGHIMLTVQHPNTLEKLEEAIGLSLAQQRDLVRTYVSGYEANKDNRKFIPLNLPP